MVTKTEDFLQRVSSEANLASAHVRRFAQRLHHHGDFAEADEAEELANALRRLAFDAVMEQPVENEQGPTD